MKYSAKIMSVQLIASSYVAKIQLIRLAKPGRKNSVHLQQITGKKTMSGKKCTKEYDVCNVNAIAGESESEQKVHSMFNNSNGSASLTADIYLAAKLCVTPVTCSFSRHVGN